MLKESKKFQLKDIVAPVSETYKFGPAEQVVFINTGDILEGRFLHKNFSNADTLPGQAKKRIKKGDILFSEIRPANKRYAMVDFDADKYVVSTKLMVLRTKDIVDNHYFYQWLTQEDTLRNLQSIAESRSGTFPQITFEAISNLELTLPPLSEQKRIANILSSFDNKIEILKKENKILEDIAENIFKEWFVKYNFPNKDGKPYRDSNGKMIDSELGPIPDGWRVGKLGEIVDVTSGKALPKDELKSDGQYPLLGANGEIGRTDKYLLNKTVIYTGRVGTLGNVFLYDAPAWYSDNTLIISPTQSFLYYIFFVLQRQQLEKLDRGSTQPLITQTDLKNILVVIPDNDILTLFNKTIQGGNDRITMSKRLLKTLDKIKTALLYKLLG